MNRTQRRAAAHKDRKLARKAGFPTPQPIPPPPATTQEPVVRSEKRKTENGFEAQNRKNAELRLKNGCHEMKKEHHEWDIRLKDAAFCHRVGQNVSQNNRATRENTGFEAHYIAEVDRLLQNQGPEVAQSAAA